MKHEKIKGKILIVDDEAQITYLLSKRLESNGYTTSIAYNGVHCLTMAKKIKPDLILLDIVMPCGNGIDAFHRFKQIPQIQSIPIIFITAFCSEETKSQIEDLGADGYFTKPYDGDELINRIEELIG
jgi:two-component system alkaline phosphatase synthesis response regulator PhoP